MEQVVLAHISDLHFGNRPFVQQSVGGLGQKGHDWLLCKALPDGLKDLLRRYGADKAYLVMTGDLTRLGSLQADSESQRNEFEVGLEYLSSQWDLEPGRPAKRIRLPKQIDSKVFSIPGNHDHWDGDSNKMFSYNPHVYSGGYFQETPWCESIDSPSGMFRVEYRSSKTLQGSARDFVQGFWGHRICMDVQNYKIWWESLPYFFQGRYFQAMDLAPYTHPGQSREPFAFTLN